MIRENTDGQYGLENVFIDLETGKQSIVMDQNSGLGHADMGFGYALGMDNWNSLPGAASHLQSCRHCERTRRILQQQLEYESCQPCLPFECQPSPCPNSSRVAVTLITGQHRMKSCAFAWMPPARSTYRCACDDR